jgi:hypothetical protein
MTTDPADNGSSDEIDDYSQGVEVVVTGPDGESLFTIPLTRERADALLRLSVGTSPQKVLEGIVNDGLYGTGTIGKLKSTLAKFKNFLCGSP